MTVEQLSHLDAAEQDLMLRTPALVAVLVAGADHKIDKKETALSAKLVHYRTFTSDEQLHAYYQACEARFEDDLNALLADWNEVTSGGEIADELKQLNTILPKVDATYAGLLKDSWRSMAKRVAEASGGLFGMGSIDGQEAVVVDLPMIE